MVDFSPEDTGGRSSTPDRRFDPPTRSERESPIDELLVLLSHQRRRDVLYYLSDHEVASLESLAATIAANEAGVSAERVSAERRESVLIDLYHNHLPKLTDRKLVEYDHRSGAIRWSSPPALFDELLACCHSLESTDGSATDDESETNGT
ncbi:DUF7344 domain-containing protein [Natronorubrum sp. DTA28]|uniref:DUF7344 domain-containing protein n=1 Tax=Natronorubrum sp. DTA28 TaxID=3447019 RepID=UPI003F84865F